MFFLFGSDCYAADLHNIQSPDNIVSIKEQRKYSVVDVEIFEIKVNV